MLQSHLTTTEQSEQTTLLPFAVSSETAPLSEVAEMSAAQQEQADAVAKLLAALERDTQRQRKWSRIAAYAAGTLFLIGLVIGLIEWRVSGHPGNWFRLLPLLNIINSASYGIGHLLLNETAAATLTKVDDVRCVGALIDVWTPSGRVCYPGRIREQARAALTRLLPRLQAEDAPQLKEAQRTLLRGVLASAGQTYSLQDFNPKFVVAILHCFAQIGDWKSLPQVQKLVTAENPSPVRVAARECLPILEALAEKQKPGETLLRASSATEAASVSPETLLRPAAPQKEVTPDTLLRPSGETPR